jgi:membrane-associated phospholipid phosphatase
MDFASLHYAELEFMHPLFVLGGTSLDQFMMFLDYFDKPAFYYFVYIVTLFAYDRKCGLRLFFLGLLSTFVLENAKVFFAQPRPYNMEPGIQLLQGYSYGFPSGAAQGLVVIFGFLALTVRKTWFTWASVLFVLLISFSRVYLALHFPSDVVGGWLIGGLLLFVYRWSLPHIEKFLSSRSFLFILLLSLLGTIFLSLLAARPYTILFAIMGFGVSVGILLPSSLSPIQKVAQRIYRPFVVLFVFFLLVRLSTIIVGSGLPERLNFYVLVPLIYFLCGLWLSWGACYFLQKIESFSFSNKA